jgi:hypothetical protein
LTLILGILIIGCYSQNGISSIAIKIADSIIGLHNRSNGTPTNFMGHQGSVKGRIHKLKWVWDGKFSCPGWTGLVGESRGSSGRTGAIENAIKDFANKVVANNLFTSEQIASFGK